jgi:medium-chain acyl-[acyl-carrier-protein] hydrolase
MRLFCFPYAGAGVTAFATWPNYLPEEIEVYGVQLPGRENRAAEPALSKIESIVESLLPDLLDAARGPYGLFGHSMGGLLAFEVARQAELRGEQSPSLLCVSGTPAPDKLGQRPSLPQASDEHILDHLAALNPRAGPGERPMWASALPALRADIAAYETYVFRPGQPLSCPISVFAGTNDPTTTPGELMRWGFHTSGDCNVRILPGTHFFIQTSRSQLIDALRQDIAASLG